MIGGAENQILNGGYPVTYAYLIPTVPNFRETIIVRRVFRTKFHERYHMGKRRVKLYYEKFL